MLDVSFSSWRHFTVTKTVDGDLLKLLAGFEHSRLAILRNRDFLPRSVGNTLAQSVQSARFMTLNLNLNIVCH